MAGGTTFVDGELLSSVRPKINAAIEQACEATLVQATVAAGGLFGTTATGAAVFPIPFDNLAVDSGLGGTTDVALAAGTITFNRTGLYRISYSFTLQGGPGGASCVSFMSKDPASTGVITDAAVIDGSVGFGSVPNGTFIMFSVSVIVSMTAADTLTIYADTASVGGSTKTLYHSTASCSINKVG